MRDHPVARPPFVDAHFHLWDRSRLDYPWLDDPANATIAATYLVADHRRATSNWNLVGAVHVDAGAAPGDGLRETEWLETVRAVDGLPDCIVARVALDDPDVADRLAEQAAHPNVRGIRHLANWHPIDRSRCVHPRDLLTDPAWRRGYSLLARHGLSSDFHGFPPQLPGLVTLAEANPGVPVVLNHLALPIVADGLDGWRKALGALASMPHVAIKLSGAGFVHQPFDPARFEHLVLEAIDLFTPARVLVATNFPTDRLFADMDRTLCAYEAILSRFTWSERRDLWGRNANRVYRMGLSL